MPDVLPGLILIPAVVSGWLAFAFVRHSVHGTSLTAAIVWVGWFLVTLTVAMIATFFGHRIGSGWLDQLWYLTAVSALCPFVAVLGARRGRLRDWNLFVVLPLMLVLEWPALAQWDESVIGRPLDLEAPTIIGYGVVLLMGAGNYFGSRWTWPVLSGVIGCGLLVSSLGTVWPMEQMKRDLLRSLAGLCWLAGFVTAWRRAKPSCDISGWNRVWLDYRNLFGQVWGTRLMLRINEVAQREAWPWRLTESGLEPVTEVANPSADASAADFNSDPRVAHCFRWLLKPFVDDDWLDRRL
jgi:hypothetical protein